MHMLLYTVTWSQDYLCSAYGVTSSIYLCRMYPHMHAHAHTCRCMHARTHTQTHACTHMYIQVNTHTRIYIHTPTHTHTHIIYIYFFIYIIRMHTAGVSACPQLVNDHDNSCILCIHNSYVWALVSDCLDVCSMPSVWTWHRQSFNCIHVMYFW